jgi:sterol desaturase/sphingolipid hydroxylase (fatty acid hydroxylase superfamily)
MGKTTIRARILWSAVSSLLICAFGVIGIKTPLIVLLLPGLYPIADSMHGLGIVAFEIALPLDFLLYWLIIFVIFSLWNWSFHRKMEVN